MSLTFARWSEDYCTGNKKIDDQHQHLFVIINQLHDAMKQGHGRDVLAETLDELIKYTIDHFISEEFLMLSKHYPRYKEHKKIHQELTNKVKDLRHKFADGHININIELLHFLNQWLAHHIKGEDIKMIKYFQQQDKIKNDGKTTLPDLKFRSSIHR